MDGFNKFQALTVAIVLMFVFVVAAIYTNTKDATAKKMEAASIEQNKVSVQDSVKHTEDVKELYKEIEFLNQRYDDLERKVSEASSEYTTCRVYGIMTENGPERQPTSQAIEIARENGVELVFACNL